MEGNTEGIETGIRNLIKQKKCCCNTAAAFFKNEVEDEK